MWALIAQSKWKTLKLSDGAELAWKEMTLPHPVTLSQQKKKASWTGRRPRTEEGHAQGFTRAVNVGVTTLWDNCITMEMLLRLSTNSKWEEKKLWKHLQAQQDEQGNVGHAPLYPLLQRNCATAVSIDRCHHVLQNLTKWHLIVIIPSAHTFLRLHTKALRLLKYLMLGNLWVVPEPRSLSFYQP